MAAGYIVRIMWLGSISNWLGYCALAGFLLWSVPAEMVQKLGLPPMLAHASGAVLMAVALLYLLLCIWRGGQHIRLRQWTLPIPRWPVALLQLALSLVSWCAIASALYVLMPLGIDWMATAQAVAVGAVVGAVSHVPGGIGVLEYVFVEMLESLATAASVLAAVVVYRALYYILPFLLALLVYVLLEVHLGSPRSTQQEWRELES